MVVVVVVVVVVVMETTHSEGKETLRNSCLCKTFYHLHQSDYAGS